MPVIRVDDEQSIDLFYIDSGPPTGSPAYATLIVLHGAQFHGEIFSKMLPLATSKHNLRLVLVNRRGYPGSTPHTPSELQILTDGDEQQQESYIATLGIHFAEFIKRFIEQNSGISESPGIVTMGWSAGNNQNLAFLANIEKLSEPTRTFLERYVKGTIVYDFPMFMYGYPPPSSLYAPYRIPWATPEEGQIASANWVGGYYNHNLSSKLLSKHPDPTILTTQQRMTEEEHKRVFHNEEGILADGLFMSKVRKQLMRDTLERAVFQPPTRTGSGGGSTRRVWERVGVKVVWCERSFGDAVATAWKMEDMAGEYGSGVSRDIEFLMIPEANHFPHWDMPEETMTFFAKIVGKMSSL